MEREQQEEIKTIRPRTIEVKLSDTDVKRISELAGKNGLTVGELIENFIGDLVGGTYSNGSDERMYAEQWLDRCGFEMGLKNSFLRYLLSWYDIEDFMETLDLVAEGEERIKDYEKTIESGVMESRNGSYTWENIVDKDGKQCYSSREEWEQNERACLEDEKENLAADKESLAGYWQEYTEQNKDCRSYEEELKDVLDYWQKYQQFLGEKEAEE